MDIKDLDGWILVEENKKFKRYQDPKNPSHYRLLVDPQETLRPTGDGTLIKWSSSTEATHYEAVDEDPSDEDISYIRTNPDGIGIQNDLFTFPNTGIGVTATINWLRVYSRARSEDASYPGDLTEVVYVDTTFSLGTTHVNIGTSYTDRYSEWVTNPDDSEAWEPADINAMEAGVRGASGGPFCLAGCAINIYYPIRCTQVWILIDYTTAVVVKAGLNIPEVLSAILG